MRQKEKRIFFCALAFCLALAAAGCGQRAPAEDTGPAGTSPAETQPTDPAHFYEEVREGLLIDAEVERTEDPDFVPKVYEIEMADITMEKVEAFLAERGEAVETVNTDITTEDGHRVFLANTDKGSHVQYTSDQNELYMGNSVYYVSEADRWYSSNMCFYG